jgi:ABC-type anion transport system duplicated permease subunit
VTLGPWLVWVPLLALINLLVFLAIRGRFGRSVLALAVAAVIGVVIGDAIGERTGLEPLRIGDMNVLAASVAAQLLMLAVTLLSALGPIEIRDGEP